MNWIVRLGLWWEAQRRVSHVEFKKAITDLEGRLAMSPSTIKELALINARISQVELFVGLKREPKPEHVPGMAKIQ